MIGKKIRSYNHLLRKLEENVPQRIMFFNHHYVSDGFIVRNIFCEGYRNNLVFFNNKKGNYTNSYFNPSKFSSYLEKNKKISSFNYVYDFRDSYPYCFGNYVIFLPEDIDEKFLEFKQQNKKLFSGINFMDEHQGEELFLYTLFHDSPNLFSWAIRAFYKQKISLDTLMNVSNWVNTYGNMSNKLSKGTITAYNTKDAIFSMYDEMIALKRLKRANDTINLFNTAQKKLLKQIDLTDEVIFVLNRFNTLSSTKCQNFIRKMSTIEDANEIIRQMSFLINLHFSWDRESFLAFLNNSENFKFDMIYDNDNIIIVNCKDYETIKHLAKTTNWCISKNKSYWNQYTCHSDVKQYILFNFNCQEDEEYSIIGFTCMRDEAITHAHSFTNSNLMSNNGISGVIKSFSHPSENINSILNNLNIPMDLIYKQVKCKYDWNKKSFIEFLDYSLSDDNYDILYDEGSKFVFTTKNQNVKFIVNDNNFSRVFNRNIEPNTSCFIFFVDFSMNEKNENRILFTNIYKDKYTSEEKPISKMMNYSCRTTSISFNRMLHEYNMPYDSICRIFSYDVVIQDSIFNLDADILDFYLKKEECIHFINNKFKFNDEIYYGIYQSLFDYNTIDILHVFYSNGISFQTMIGKDNMNQFIHGIISKILEFGNGKLPSLYEIENMYNSKIPYDKKMLSGYFSALELILNNESHLDFYSIIKRVYGNISYKSLLYKYLIDKFIDKLDFSKKNYANDIMIKSILSSKNKNHIEYLMSYENMNEYYVNMLKNNLILSES